jgi:hypothetical protein
LLSLKSCLQDQTERVIAMLPDSFVDWWFAPWTCTAAPAAALPAQTDLLGQRDGYRLWCEKAGVVTAFPAAFDAGWQVAMMRDAQELMATARLFAGLFAARLHDHAALSLLPIADRKWCMSIAPTQPLTACKDLPFDGDDGLEVRGLIELARRLEVDFPGFWSRLRLLLPVETGERVERLLQPALQSNEGRGSSPLRAQRCWSMCRTRAGRVEEAAPMPAEAADEVEAADEQYEPVMAAA